MCAGTKCCFFSAVPRHLRRPPRMTSASTKTRCPCDVCFSLDSDQIADIAALCATSKLLARLANLRMQHVPYRGSAQVVADLLAKRLDFMIDPPTLLIEFIQASKLRALATTGATRCFSLPGVQTVSEAALPGYVVTSWQGLAGPVGLPPIADRLNIEVADILTESATIERLRALGNDPRPSSRGEFKDRVVADINNWTAVVAAANIERI
jgi:tripartite-type tricarboxylate transporter receptor subunit TctC